MILISELSLRLVYESLVLMREFGNFKSIFDLFQICLENHASSMRRDQVITPVFCLIYVCFCYADQIGLTPEEVISKIMANPEVAMAFQNPRVQAAIMDVCVARLLGFDLECLFSFYLLLKPHFFLLSFLPTFKYIFLYYFIICVKLEMVTMLTKTQKTKFQKKMVQRLREANRNGLLVGSLVCILPTFEKAGPSGLPFWGGVLSVGCSECRIRASLLRGETCAQF